jgi:hypothetical protein
MDHRTYKYTRGYYLRADSPIHRGIHLRTVILDDYLLNDCFNRHQHYADHRL